MEGGDEGASRSNRGDPCCGQPSAGSPCARRRSNSRVSAPDGPALHRVLSVPGPRERAVKERKPLVFHDLLKVEKDGTAVDTSAKTYSCKLKHDAVVVTMEAGIFNVNQDLLGLCSADVTGVVSISRNGKVILKEEAFEDLDCARERRIRSVTVHDGSAKVDIVWTPYDK